jgi:hypothetical protein
VPMTLSMLADATSDGVFVVGSRSAEGEDSHTRHRPNHAGRSLYR